MPAKAIEREEAMETSEPMPPKIDGAKTLDEAVAYAQRFTVLPSAPYYDVCALKTLDEAVAYAQRFTVLPSAPYYDVCALWDAGTHAYRAFQAYPHLGFVSDQPASGKSRAMGINGLMCAKPKTLTNYTSATLTRWLTKGRTVILDETDTVFRTD